MTAQELKEIKFWTTVTVSKGETEQQVLKINQLQFVQFLRHHGFFIYGIQDDSIFCQIIDGRIIKPVTITAIQHFVYDWVEKLNNYPKLWEGMDNLPASLSNKILSNVGIYFNKQKLFWLRPVEPIKFNHDTLTTKYIYYQNGFVEVTKNGATLKPYDKLTGYIWDSQQLNRKIDLDAAIENRNIENFLGFVSANEKYPGRFFSLQTIIGYLLHDFYEYKLKLPLFTDSGISDGNDSNGRTGKTLLMRLIGHMNSSNVQDPTIKSYVEIGMKDFKYDDKFKWSRIHHDTKLTVLNDLKPYFNMDILYNAITDGMLVEQKNMHPFIKLSKMAATTNKTIRIDGRSSSDRVVEFEVSEYFNDKHTPQMEFGEWFFRDWNTKDWNDYDRTMINAIIAFIKNDCTMDAPVQINLNKRKLIDHTSEEFLDFMDDLNLKPGDEKNKNQLFDSFLKKYPDYEKSNKFKQRTFTQWVRTYCNYSDEWQNWDKSQNERRDSEGGWYIFIAAPIED